MINSTKLREHNSVFYGYNKLWFKASSDGMNNTQETWNLWV